MSPRTPFRRVASSLFALALFAGPFALANGCASRGPDLASRMGTARANYESVGYAPFGPSETGKVEEGKDSRVAVKLKEGCFLVVAFAGDGIKTIEATLNDPAGKPVGEVKKQEGQVSVKQCVVEAGTYTLVVKGTGGGAFIVQPYLSSTKTEGGGPTPTPCEGPDCDDPGGPDPGGNPGGNDDCQTGIDLSPGGSAKGNSKKASNNTSVHWSCAASDGPAVIYRVHIEGRHKLVVDMTAPSFDAVMGLYRAASDGWLCDSVNELECSDDSEGNTGKGHIEAIVDTGDYGIMVGGYEPNDKGDFEIKTRLEDAPSLSTICSGAHSLVSGTKSTDLIAGDGSNFRASCGNSEGGESLFKFDLKQRSRVRVGGKVAGGSNVVVSLRTRCDDATSEVACSATWHIDGVSWTGIRDAGNYTLFVDSSDPALTGTAEATMDIAADGGDGAVESDSCTSAKALQTSGTFNFDTLHAKADTKASCASDGAADLVYKLDVKVKSRIFFSATEDEGRHVVAIQKACGDTKGELSCDLVAQSKGVDATLDPGSYFVIVKGKGKDDFGRAKMSVKLRELAPAQAACKAATKLVAGTAVKDSTKDAPDRFASQGCGGQIAQQSSGDKVYQFTLKEKSKVNLQLKGGTFYNAIMSLRSDCSDPTRNEIVCSNTYSKTIDRELDPGTYYVVVDGYGVKSEGDFNLELTTKPVK